MKHLVRWGLCLFFLVHFLVVVAGAQEVTLSWDHDTPEKVKRYQLFVDGALHEEFQAPTGALLHTLEMAPGSYIFELVACNVWCSAKSNPWTSPEAVLSAPVIVNLEGSRPIIINIGNVGSTPTK